MIDDTTPHGGDLLQRTADHADELIAASKAQRYVQARQDGHGSRAAARIAGYAHGVPSSAARVLWRDVRTSVSSTEQDLTDEEAALTARLRVVRRQLAAQKAVSLLDATRDEHAATDAKTKQIL